MALRSRWWRIGALVFGVGNVAGMIYHIGIGEMGAAIGHAGAVAGTMALWLTVFSRGGEPEPVLAESPQLDAHLDNLQRSVDAIAIEVERVGEAQRFAQKILEGRHVESEVEKQP
jgi:hypothetical protein